MVQVASLPDRLEWRTLEHAHTEKSREWFLVLGVIFASLTIGAIILGNMTLALFFVVGGLALAVSGNRPPSEIDVAIGVRGVRVDDVFYPYENLESFWVEEEYGHRRLILKSTKYFMPYVVVLLPDDLDTEVLTAFLLQHLAGEELHEPFFQQVLERLGF